MQASEPTGAPIGRARTVRSRRSRSARTAERSSPSPRPASRRDTGSRSLRVLDACRRLCDRGEHQRGRDDVRHRRWRRRDALGHCNKCRPRLDRDSSAGDVAFSPTESLVAFAREGTHSESQGDAEIWDVARKARPKILNGEGDPHKYYLGWAVAFVWTAGCSRLLDATGSSTSGMSAAAGSSERWSTQRGYRRTLSASVQPGRERPCHLGWRLLRVAVERRDRCTDRTETHCWRARDYGPLLADGNSACWRCTPTARAWTSIPTLEAPRVRGREPHAEP